MPTELALISDTHIPSRASHLPAWVRERIVVADHVVHAGDFDSPAALETIRNLADGNLTAVAGNVDPPDLDLPVVATVAFEGVEFVVTHGNRGDGSYEEDVARTVREEGGDGAVGVSGHSHEAMDEVYEGIRLLNPGSATGARPAAETTMMTVTVADGDLDVTHHRE